MPLVHYWTPNFNARIAIGVAEIVRGPVQISAATDMCGNPTHPATELMGAAIRPMLIPAFNPIETIITIEQEPEFAFMPYTYAMSDGHVLITAIPYIDHMRRSVLPDWYVPTTEATR